MGADWTLHTTSPGVADHGLGASPIPESRHVIGTARMGDDPATSVVDRWGRVHTLDNVVVADSSVFVTSAGYGPDLDPGGPGFPGRPPPGRDGTRLRQSSPGQAERPVSGRPRVSSMVPAIGPPPLATAATSGGRPPGRTTWRAPPSPRSWTQASWIRPKPWRRPPESWPPAVFSGSTPSRAMAPPPSMNGPLSPRPQNPSASSHTMASTEKPS